MLASGRTLSLPKKNPPLVCLATDPPATPEWEFPYTSPHPVEGELMDLPQSFWDKLLDLYNRYRAKQSGKAPASN